MSHDQKIRVETLLAAAEELQGGGSAYCSSNDIPEYWAAAQLRELAEKERLKP